jgi:HEAT repeat protein
MKKRTVIVLAVALLGVVSLTLFWANRSILEGWLRGEPFYAGLPASHWVRAVRAWHADKGKPAGPAPWLDRLLDFFGRIDDIPDVLDGHPHAVPVLLVLVRDPDAAVRQEAVIALAHMARNDWELAEDEQIVPLLLQGLKDDDTGVRASAAVSLGDVGPEEATVVPALIARLEAEPEAGCRVVVISALQNRGERARNAVPALLRTIADPNEHELVRYAAFEALKKIDPATAEILRPVIHPGPPPSAPPFMN